MRDRIQRSAAPALVCLILSSLALGSVVKPAAAKSWGPQTLALSSDGRHAYVGDPWLAGVAVIDTTANQLVSVLKVGGTDLAVSPDSTQLYAADGNQLSIVNLATGKVLTTITLGKQTVPFRDSLVVSPDGQRVYVANSQTSNVVVVDPMADQVLASIPVGPAPRAMVLQPEKQRLFVANYNRTISVIDTAKNQVVQTLHLPSTPLSLALSGDGRWLYVGHDGASTRMILISTATLGQVGQEIAIPGGHASALAVAPDNKQLFILSTEYPILAAIDLTADPRVSGVAAPGKGLVSLTVSPDGHHLYTTDAATGTVAVLDPKTLQVTATIDLKKKPAGKN